MQLSHIVPHWVRRLSVLMKWCGYFAVECFEIY